MVILDGAVGDVPLIQCHGRLAVSHGSRTVSRDESLCHWNSGVLKPNLERGLLESPLS